MSTASLNVGANQLHLEATLCRGISVISTEHAAHAQNIPQRSTDNLHASGLLPTLANLLPGCDICESRYRIGRSGRSNMYLSSKERGQANQSWGMPIQANQPLQPVLENLYTNIDLIMADYYLIKRFHSNF